VTITKQALTSLRGANTVNPGKHRKSELFGSMRKSKSNRLMCFFECLISPKFTYCRIFELNFDRSASLTFDPTFWVWFTTFEGQKLARKLKRPKAQICLLYNFDCHRAGACVACPTTHSRIYSRSSERSWLLCDNHEAGTLHLSTRTETKWRSARSEGREGNSKRSQVTCYTSLYCGTIPNRKSNAKAINFCPPPHFLPPIGDKIRCYST